MTTTPPKIDLRLGAAALRAPAAFMVDSRPQAILKLRPRNSFDYRVRYKPQLKGFKKPKEALNNDFGIF